MTNELKYNGYSAEPSDYECADGDLATSIGLIQEEGAVKPLFPPSVVHSFEKGLTVKYIHETVNFRHYILYQKGGAMSYTDENKVTYWTLRNFETTTIHEVNSVGNTLIVLAADGMHYFLWKNNAYSYLGTEIPELPLSFGLQGEMVRTDEFDITLPERISESILFGHTFSEANKKAVTEQVLAKVNKFIADNSTNAGRFIFPFLLRYAYRLYDGSLTKHSAPILMITSSDVVPIVEVKEEIDSDADGLHTVGFKGRVFSMRHQIDFSAVNQEGIDSVKDWKDVVKSVEVFISAPIYAYNQNGECDGIYDLMGNDYCVCKHINQNSKYDTVQYPLLYKFDRTHKLYLFTFDELLLHHGVKLPARNESDVIENIKNCSQFYFLKTIEIENLSTERKVLAVNDNYLQSLVTREVMTDDYDSHDKLIPNYSFTYNNRLNIANLKKVLFKGFNASSMFIYSNGYVVSSANDLSSSTVPVSVYFYINQDGKEIITKGDLGYFGVNMPLLYLFFPNTNAYKAVIERIQFTETSSKIVRYEVNLEKHNFLNGSFYFGGWEDVKTTTTTIPAISTDRTISLPNKIYTSEVSNPFYFPVLGINTVGTGDILGISTAAKALSEGQFGQFPLYAFTSEGVWALEVSSTGTYSTKQPITRDVVLGKNSITQIDSAVLFATDRGIMLLSGSNVQCISDVLNSDEMWNISKLPNAHNLITLYNGKVDDNGQQKQITEDDIAFLPFRDFVKECSMIYDYVNQRIIVYNPKESYAYVYSFKSQNWGMMFSGIASNVNSYPEALANTKDNKLVNFSVPGTQVTTSLLITRPFTLNDANGFKTIDSIIQRGMFKSNHVQQVLYGSNDLENWHTVWSSVDRIMRGFRGTPYKAFRLALICSLEKGESIYGCSISYQQRLANKLR